MDKKQKLKGLEKYDTIKEQQLTEGNRGYFLNQAQVFSSDNRWIVFDNRNDDTQIIKNGSIGMVNVNTREIRNVYTATDKNEFGPGVGAAVFNPKTNEVVFIHGLANADSVRPYTFTRRTAVSVAPFETSKPVRLDARDISPPFTPGALRGGTHAYSISGDGQWISFTYNDGLMAELAKTDATIKDLRTIGVMVPSKPVRVSDDDTFENFDGERFATVVATVTEFPRAGSDEMSKAYEEGWIGTEGYLNAKGEVQNKALAFLGDVRDGTSQTITEVFVADLPDPLIDAKDIPHISGTESTRPEPPAGVHQRRLTRTQDRKFPGVQGPRQWIRSLPDGSLIFFPMKDDTGMVQIFAISPNGGALRQMTENDFSLETSFSIDPKGNYLAYGYHQDVYLTAIKTGNTKKISPERDYKSGELSNINWSNDGKILAYNRKVTATKESYYQIFLINLK
ncbi:DUF3748 domain-containing protein [Pricia antarctica]|nr:DUF3748 domain-containing protein [Pricia antarctica]